MSGKYALVIGNTEYTDSGLAKLTAPGRDAEEFARVLSSPEIAGFDEVLKFTNENVFNLNEAIEGFFLGKKPDDLLIFYFSGHGVRDESGSLFLAVKNTNRARLRSTSIKADFVREMMDQGRSRRQVIILDCCNSGAFANGTKAETGGAMGIAATFKGTGYGRVILTATDSTQFAWEGDKIIGDKITNSLFTHFLVKGLEGEADEDGDGKITVDELYDYAYKQIVSHTPKQTPGKWSYQQQGEIILRQSTRIEDIKPVPLPDDLLAAAKNSFPYVREAAVRQLDELLKGKNLGLARSARETLEHIAENDDSKTISRAAFQALEAIRQAEQGAFQKAEEERLAKLEVERIAEEERQVREQAEAERKAEAERLAAAQKAEEERIAKAKLETERLAEEKRLADQAEKERQAKAEAKRLADEKAATEQLAVQKAEEERIAKAKLEAYRLAEEKRFAEEAEKRRMAAKQEQDEKEHLAKAKLEIERLTEEKKRGEVAERQRIAKTRVEQSTQQASTTVPKPQKNTNTTSPLSIMAKIGVTFLILVTGFYAVNLSSPKSLPPTPTENDAHAVTEETSEVPLSTNVQATEPLKVVEITLWHAYGTGSAEIIELNKLINQAAVDLPQFKINAQQVPFNDIFNKYDTDVAAGGGPDMFIAPNDNLGGQARAGTIADITDLVAGKLGDYSELSQGGMMYDGKMYGLPESLKAIALWYNTDMLPEAPATTDELKALMEGGTPVAISFGCYHHWGFFGSFGGQIFDDEFNFVADEANQANVASAISYLNDLYQISVANGWPRNDSDGLAAFTEGSVAAITNGNWAIDDYRNALGDKLAVAPIPAGPGGASNSLLLVDGWYFNPNSENTEAAIEVALYLTNTAASQSMMDNAGHVPANTTVEVTDPLIQGLLDAFSTSYFRPQVEAMGYYWGNFCGTDQVFDAGTPAADWVKTAFEGATK